MNVMVTGGCGYIGTQLVNLLLKNNMKVLVIDTQWFGNYLSKHPNLIVKKKDIRDLKISDFKKIDSIIHLANIANDPSVELNQNLSWDVNVLASKKIIELSIKAGVKHFLYASSGSVYGVKKEKKVTEDLDLLPISVYNRTKMISERVLLSYSNKIKVHCIRPATVCGFSDRMRLDLSVNMLTFQALKNKKITVFGGKQIRPNIHIKDMVNLYLFFLKNKKFPVGCYNAGFENLSILNIAKKIQKKINSKIVITKSNDNRSYRLDSSKLLKLGFAPKFTINDSIEELIELFDNKILKDKKSFFNVKWMKSLKI
tara:strand:+ start:707 stop:1645 length:939 start_codon:yes stop_codon:yes gene_type:complete